MRYIGGGESGKGEEGQEGGWFAKSYHFGDGWGTSCLLGRTKESGGRG